MTRVAVSSTSIELSETLALLASMTRDEACYGGTAAYAKYGLRAFDTFIDALTSLANEHGRVKLLEPSEQSKDDPLEPSLKDQAASMRYTIQELIKANEQMSARLAEQSKDGPHYCSNCGDRKIYASASSAAAGEAAFGRPADLNDRKQAKDDLPAARARFILALAKLEVGHDVDLTNDEIDALVEAVRG